MLQVFQPEYGRGIGRHAPIATRRKADAADLWSVGHAGTLELLAEETAAESL